MSDADAIVAIRCSMGFPPDTPNEKLVLELAYYQALLYKMSAPGLVYQHSKYESTITREHVQEMPRLLTNCGSV